MQVSDSERGDARLDGIDRRLEALERRLLALEGRAPAAPPAPVVESVAAAPEATDVDAVAILALIGRTFVILAGAYLLRAITESGVVSHAAGVALGLAYASAWPLIADRVAARSTLAATFYGACGVLIGMPLVWEAATRFALIGPAAAALLLSALAAVVLGVAWHRRLQPLAWAVTLGTITAATALLIATQAIVVFAGVFIALGVATLWLGYDRGWIGPRWPAALAADAVVLGLAGRALTTPPRDAPQVVLAVQMVLLASYLGSIAVRTLVRGRDVIPFEVAQTATMLVAGLGGAMFVADQTGTAQRSLGAALLVMAAILYAVAFAFIDRQRGRRVNFYFYTSLALAFALTGSGLVLKGAPLGLVWAGLAILTSAATRRYGRLALAIHSEVYVAAAAMATGLLTTAAVALVGSMDAWPPIEPAAWAVLASLGLVVLFTSRPPEGAGITARIPAWALAALAVVIAGGVCTAVAVRAFEGFQFAARPGLVATVRTGVIAVAVVAIAWLGRRDGTRAFGYLLYPLLAWGAVKLVVEDFSSSAPALLFVALALYGAALIVGPRMAGRRSMGS
jgi:hypothetical protein